MPTTDALTENSRQGINFQIPPCIGLEGRLSPNLRPGMRPCLRRNRVGPRCLRQKRPVNLVDKNGRWYECMQYSEGICQGYYFDPSPHFHFDDTDWNGDTGPGGGSSDFDQITANWWPPLSESQGQVLLSSIGTAQAKMDTGSCARFTTGLIGQMNLASGLNITSGMIKNAMASSNYWDGTSSQLPVVHNGIQTTIANVFTSNPNIIAHAETPVNLSASIFLNAGFFTGSQGLRNSTIIHEGFHAIWAQIFNDEGLAKLIGWNEKGDASQWLTKQFMDNCGGNLR